MTTIYNVYLYVYKFSTDCNVGSSTESNGDDFLGASWVNCDRLKEVVLGRAHLDGDGETL